jgi:hypothetical protein
VKTPCCDFPTLVFSTRSPPINTVISGAVEPRAYPDRSALDRDGDLGIEGCGPVLWSPEAILFDLASSCIDALLEIPSTTHQADRDQGKLQIRCRTASGWTVQILQNRQMHL